jgi:sarcosine oxidase subunit alpha
VRLAADAARQFGGIELDRSKPLSFRLDGRKIDGFAGDTVLSAVLAAGIHTYGTYYGAPVGLSERLAPLVQAKAGPPLPMARLLARDGMELGTVGAPRRLRRRQDNSLGHVLDTRDDPPWRRAQPETSLETDLLVIGGGVAGLAAAETAARAGRKVVLVERRPWFGGDARYFGSVGEDETPEALVARLLAALTQSPNATLLRQAEAFALSGRSATVHQVEQDGDMPRARVIRVTGQQVVLATGATQRLPVFPGNRLPSVMTSVEAYHLAKRYGVTRGASAVVTTQSNFGYRVAMRLNDAGIEVRRIFDPRINPQSRFIDFAKASGLTVGNGQLPVAAAPGRATIGHTEGALAAATLDAAMLIVGGTWQPDLTLWMVAGGNVRWSAEQHAMVSTGPLDHVALAGSAGGYRAMTACVQSGVAAEAALFGDAVEPVAESEIASAFETGEAPTTIAPPSDSSFSFLDAGQSLAVRPNPGSEAKPAPEAHALSLADVAACVELGLVVAADAGAVAEERGAPGGDLKASDWAPPPLPPRDGVPAWLTGRFGDAPVRVHLGVDANRKFETGALVYPVGDRLTPDRAVGVILEPASPGGIALLDRAVAEGDRFIVELAAGPSPARPLKV